MPTDQHTSGPWQLLPGTYTDSPTPIVCMSGRIKKIAVACVMPDQRGNATLIAAAPDLLAALERLHAIWDVIPDCGIAHNDVTDAFLQARHTIAKARGRS